MSKVILCPNCKLCYRTDPAQHKDPAEYCPRCGYKYHQDEEDDEDG